MLVLTRKQDETIVVDGTITIKVLRIRGNAVRIGIEAPEDVAIRRGEINPLPQLREEQLAGEQQAGSLSRELTLELV